MELLNKVALIIVLFPWQLGHCSTAPRAFLSSKVPAPLLKRLEANVTTIDGLVLYLPINVDPDSICGYGIQEMIDALERYDGVHPTWSHKVVDSWGKSFSAGLIYGNTWLMGAYDECIHSASPNNTIRGRYCRIGLWKYKGRHEAINFKKFASKSRPQKLQAIDGILWETTETMYYSTCIPNVCTGKDLKDSMQEFLDESQVYAFEFDCHADNPHLQFETTDITFLCVLSILALLILAASAIDVFSQMTGKEKLAKGGLKFLLPFSAYTNLKKLFHMTPEKTSGSITCLYAMRVLSMTWVIYCHQQTVYFVMGMNYNDLGSKTDDIWYQIISNGYPSVDSFFFMSGLLVCYNILKEIKKTGKFNIVLFYIHRLIRLIPPIALLAGLYASIPHFFVSGPYSSYWYYFQRSCQTAWWRSLLFVTNLVQKPVQEGFGNSCLPQDWYLGADTQLYIIAPLFVLPLVYYRPVGEAWIYTMTLLSCIIPAFITHKYDLPPTGIIYNPNPEDFMKRLYLVPWARAGPWIIGMWFGFLLHKQGDKRIKLQSWQVVCGWTAAVGAGLMVVFCMWNYNTIPPTAWYDGVTKVMYAGFHRSIWALCLGWIVFACHNGYGGLVDDFMSHPIWQPMSRMIFTIYLAAFPLQYAISYNTRTANYFTHYNKVLETVGALIMSTVVAVLVTITVESPIIGLEKLILRPRGIDGGPQKARLQGVNNEGFGLTDETEILVKDVTLHKLQDMEELEHDHSDSNGNANVISNHVSEHKL